MVRFSDKEHAVYGNEMFREVFFTFVWHTPYSTGIYGTVQNTSTLPIVKPYSTTLQVKILKVLDSG
jgi:hypothetical protein